MAKKAPTRSERRVVVRRLKKSDFKGVVALHAVCYPGIPSWTRPQFAHLLETFPEGQLCVELDGQIVAVSSTIRVDGEAFVRKHVYSDVENGDQGTAHDPEGDSLYGIDISVKPSTRGLRFARRLYKARQDLVRSLELRRMLIGARIPGFHAYKGKMSIDQYVANVVSRKVTERSITAQLSNGFSIRRILPGYLPEDSQSCGYALLMEWLNPDYVPPQREAPDSVRVATINYQMRTVADFSEFARQCEFFMDTAADYRSDFVLFPELLTNQLVSLLPPGAPAEQARKLDQFTAQYVDFFSKSAIKYAVNVIAGTHLTVEDGSLYNIAFLFHRDGRIDKQYKLHITPSERHWWGVSSGDEVRVFDTDMGRIAILICYDAEFPEVARAARAQGATIFFIPYNTDIRAAHIRVRACAQARCIENHAYAVLSGAVGNLPQVHGADIHYAQAAVLTPSDIAFPRDGIAAQATENVEALIMHDLDMFTLRRTNRQGSVRPWADRRTDLYEVRFGLEPQKRGKGKRRF